MSHYEEIIFTNNKGESLRFNNNSTFFASDIRGIGDVDANVQMQRSPYQDGATHVDSILLPRDISFEVMILGVDHNDVSKKRAHLARIFNPKLGLGLFEYKTGTVSRFINAVPETVPRYPGGIDNRSRSHQLAMVDLVCPNPYWKSPKTVEEPTFEPLFQFPFEGTFELGIQRDQRIIINNGDAPAPLQVEFYGPATNPKITNKTTGEFIKINQKLLDNEHMKIDTIDKSVFFVDENGSERNVFNWIDLDSTFFKLEVGENEIEYTADSNIQGAVVNISYSELFVGV